jgi:restriction endonuclease/NACHT domain-containing protein
MAVTHSTPGKAFERQVADAYRVLGYQVTPNDQLPGKQTDLTARRIVAGAPPIVLAIECKDEKTPVDNDTVFEFVSRIVAQRAASLITSGVLVSASGFTAPARAAGSEHAYVSLLSWDELASQILDVRHQLQEYVQQYEHSPIFNEYLPLAVESLSWSTDTSTVTDDTSADDLTRDWLNCGVSGSRIPRSLFILADFGAGKTTLLRYIQYDRAKAYLDKTDTRVPLFVSLREFRDSQDVTALLRTSFRDSYYRDLPSDLLWRRIKDGQFVVLLDGFDEMADRSDAPRRLELFYQLLEILRSTSPTVVTSRPSYFVESGELNNLLAMLREREDSLTAPDRSRRSGGSSAAADRLRRKLVERHRERRLAPGANDDLRARDVTMVRLLPLTRDRVEAFVGRHAEELQTVNATTEDVMAFIDRTYDLTDLASRPLLLNLIISSIVLNGLDIHDTEKQYGASGLYEIYTRAKLDVDLAKGHTRRGGLSLDLRRLLAEELAVYMYNAGVLEVQFTKMLEDLVSGPSTLDRELAASGLSRDEIATDFATCSFATVRPDGTCRFIHKSFRGFFVARVLKEGLGNTHHPMLSEWLEREVLYFLGGFAPTQPYVGERLWAKFLRADKAAKALRRNVLVAYLYSSPEHDTRRIADAEISEAEFGRLSFVGSRMKNVTWRNITITQFVLREVDWHDVAMADSNIVDMAIDSGKIELDVVDTAIETLSATDTKGTLEFRQAQVSTYSVVKSELAISAEDTRFAQVHATRSKIACEAVNDGSAIEHMSVSDSHVTLDGPWRGRVSASRSAIAYGLSQSGGMECQFRSCVVMIDEFESAPKATMRLGRNVEADVGSVFLINGNITPALLGDSRSGVFGTIGPDKRREVIPGIPKIWGALRAEHLIQGMQLGPSDEGCRWGNVLLLRDQAYEQLISADGPLSALNDLRRLIDAQEHLPVNDELCQLLASVRHQYDEIIAGEWREFRPR